MRGLWGTHPVCRVVLRTCRCVYLRRGGGARGRRAQQGPGGGKMWCPLTPQRGPLGMELAIPVRAPPATRSHTHPSAALSTRRVTDPSTGAAPVPRSSPCPPSRSSRCTLWSRSDSGSVNPVRPSISCPPQPRRRTLHRACMTEPCHDVTSVTPLNFDSASFPASPVGVDSDAGCAAVACGGGGSTVTGSPRSDRKSVV